MQIKFLIGKECQKAAWPSKLNIFNKGSAYKI